MVKVDQQLFTVRFRILLCQPSQTTELLWLTGSQLAEGYNNRPSLTLLIWEDGALFDDAMNDYIGSDSPSGLDPFRPLMLPSNSSTRGSTSQLMSVIPQNSSIA